MEYKSHQSKVSRREFIETTGLIAAGTLLTNPLQATLASFNGSKKKRLALVGTGIRGLSFFGKYVIDHFSDVAEFVALSDINPGRLTYAREYLGLKCPVYTDFEKMLDEVEIDLLFVTTVDATHHQFIIKALERNIDVATEKPMTTDELKCQMIVDAARHSEARLIMCFNYRYGQIFTKLKQNLLSNEIGAVTSVDFNWYLNNFHGADYFRRWHGERRSSGTLLLHKAAHHFDLLNWWIGSDPVEVHAFGSLEHYGRNGSFRGERCSACQHQTECPYYWDISKNKMAESLYVENEKYDGYIRDNCLFRENIDIFDKMVLNIRYANQVQVSYSLTCYSPYEGFRIAFNGQQGRMETWEGIPWLEKLQQDQSNAYATGMDQTSHANAELQYHEISTMVNFKDHQTEKFPFIRKGHWGGDSSMMEEIIRGTIPIEGLHHASNVRDGAMAVLIGIAARKSIDEGRSVKISELTDLVPKIEKWG